MQHKCRFVTNDSVLSSFSLFLSYLNKSFLDKGNGPRTISDIMINAGKILENNKTLGESRVPVSELSGGVITMLVVVKPPAADKHG